MEVASATVRQEAVPNITTVLTMRGILGAHQAKLSGCKAKKELVGET